MQMQMRMGKNVCMRVRKMNTGKVVNVCVDGCGNGYSADETRRMRGVLWDGGIDAWYTVAGRRKRKRDRGGAESFEVVLYGCAAGLAAGVPPVLAEALPGGEVGVAGRARVRAQPPAGPGSCARLHLGIRARTF